MLEWWSVCDRLPEIDFSKPKFDWQVKVLAHWGDDPTHVAEMTYSSNGYAKTEKGKTPRFELNGRPSPWKVTHWAVLPKFEKVE